MDAVRRIIVGSSMPPAVAQDGPKDAASPPVVRLPDAPRTGMVWPQRVRAVRNAVGYMAVVGPEILRDGLTTVGHRLGAAVGRSPRVGAPLASSRPDMTGKVCVVTGANSGIGFATARQLAELGAEVVLVCRNVVKGEAARARLRATVPEGTFRLVQGDLGTRSSTSDLGARLLADYPEIDVLINNAGILATSPGLTTEGVDRSLQVNHLGPAELTLQLKDALRSRKGRVVNVSSGMHHQGRLQRSGDAFSVVHAYGDSKLRSLAFAAALARRLEQDGVIVKAAHPGGVKTEIAAGGDLTQRILSKGMAAAAPLLRDPDKGAETVVWLAASEDVPDTEALYWFDQAPGRVSKRARDEAVQELVWTETMAQLGRDPLRW